MRILSKRERIHCEEYYIWFAWKDNPNAGFSFTCDKDGNIIESKMNELSGENYKKCLSGEFDVINNGIQKHEWHYYQQAIGQCSCGEEVELAGFTNTCSCGLDYNSSGQQLAPREFWGEELTSGETLSDILRIR